MKNGAMTLISPHHPEFKRKEHMDELRQYRIHEIEI